MNILSSVLLLFQIAATPVIAPLTEEAVKNVYWEPTGSGLVFITMYAGDGDEIQVAFPATLVPCNSETHVAKKKGQTPPFIILKSEPAGAPSACYLVFTEPVGYLKNGQLESLIEKTYKGGK